MIQGGTLTCDFLGVGLRRGQEGEELLNNFWKLSSLQTTRQSEVKWRSNDIESALAIYTNRQVSIKSYFDNRRIFSDNMG